MSVYSSAGRDVCGGNGCVYVFFFCWTVGFVARCPVFEWLSPVPSCVHSVVVFSEPLFFSAQSMVLELNR